MKKFTILIVEEKKKRLHNVIKKNEYMSNLSSLRSKYISGLNKKISQIEIMLLFIIYITLVNPMSEINSIRDNPYKINNNFNPLRLINLFAIRINSTKTVMKDTP